MEINEQSPRSAGRPRHWADDNEITRALAASGLLAGGRWPRRDAFRRAGLMPLLWTIERRAPHRRGGIAIWARRMNVEPPRHGRPRKLDAKNRRNRPRPTIIRS